MPAPTVVTESHGTETETDIPMPVKSDAIETQTDAQVTVVVETQTDEVEQKPEAASPRAGHLSNAPTCICLEVSN